MNNIERLIIIPAFRKKIRQQLQQIEKRKTGLNSVPQSGEVFFQGGIRTMTDEQVRVAINELLDRKTPR